MQFMISVIDDGQAVAAGRTDSANATERAAVEAFNERIIAGGHLVYAAGLAATSSAVVIDNRGDEAVITDGPFTEAKEFVAGLWIWEVPDSATALALAEEASRACNRRIEVRATLDD